MPDQPAATQNIDEVFTATITIESNSGWACVVMPRSGAIFGTRRPVKVGGTVGGHPFRATLLPIGDGTHMVPLEAALRRQLGMSVGDDVTVHLDQRHS